MKFVIILSTLVACALARPGFISSPLISTVPIAYRAYVPLEISSQYHAQDSLGQYNYGYTSSLSSKAETRALNGVTQGAYSYVDPNGQIQNVQYTADAINGFRVAASNLPVAPAVPEPPVQEVPQPVQETAEVAEARAAHLAAIEDARQRNEAAAADAAAAAKAAADAANAANAAQAAADAANTAAAENAAAAAKAAQEAQAVQVNTIETIAAPAALSVPVAPIQTVVSVPALNSFGYSYKTIQPQAYTISSHQYLNPYALSPLAHYSFTPFGSIASITPGIVAAAPAAPQSESTVDSSDSVEITAARSATEEKTESSK